MSFTDFKLHPSLTKALTEQGYTEYTPIQHQAIPLVLQQRDVLGCAQTGTGKTAAFVLPILQNILEDKIARRHKQLCTLILAPTRELATQIADTVRDLGRFTGIRHAVIFGGVPQNPQVNKIRAGIDILVATPGRLKDLMQQGFISLQQVKYLVLDEADRMLDMGFVHDVKQIIRHIPANRQTLFFSATMPAEIQKLSSTLLRDPVKVEITPVASTVDIIEQYVHFSEKAQKPALLVSLLEKDANETAIVFTQMKHMADKLSRLLNNAGLRAGAIHGNKSQRQREQALEQFKNKSIRILVATDIAARGIDIDKLGIVINYDLPQVAETYVHRIGRTGRAGATGTAISICSPDERPLLSDIQKLIKRTITVVGATPALSGGRTATTQVNTSAPAFSDRRPRRQFSRNNYGKRQAQAY